MRVIGHVWSSVMMVKIVVIIPAVIGSAPIAKGDTAKIRSSAKTAQLQRRRESKLNVSGRDKYRVSSQDSTPGMDRNKATANHVD